MRQRYVRYLTLLVLILSAGSLPAQSDERNLNLYYRYPMAIAGDFHSWNPFGDYASDFNVYEGSATFRFPILSAPLFQPLIRGSYVRFDSLSGVDPEKWDHNHLFVGAGLAMVNRLSKNFEIGAEVVGGYSHTTYNNVASQPVGYGNVVASVAPRISLVPSFGFALNVKPTVRYSQSLGVVDRFDGISFSIGVGAEFRFGEDPDAPQTQIRSIRLSEPQIDSVFAAMQSYYVDNPVGRVTIENTEGFTIEDVQVAFFQSGFMDSPTPAARIAELSPGEAREIDLLAAYNANVFQTEGVTPVTGEVIVTYLSRGRPAEQRASVVYDLHDKAALTWTDDRKMGSFITPADSAIRNYMSFVRQTGKDDTVATASEPLQAAMLAYHALIELGVVYQIDPSSPFTQVQSNTHVVDSVSLPRDTLNRLAGDCDDLTALYAAMLESVGIETGFITTPGHIYVAFNSKVPAREYLMVHPDRDMLLIVDDEVWVPVEITMLGEGDFMEAWRYGIDEWDKFEDNQNQRGFYRTAESQSVYRPVGLREVDLGLQYGDPGNISRGFSRDFTELRNTIIGSLRGRAESRDDRRSYNTLGIYAARLGRYDEAIGAFETAARMDSSYVDPRINLGSVHFLQERYNDAIQAFQEAVITLQLSGRPNQRSESTLYINLAKASYEAGRFVEAEQFYERAAAVDSGRVEEFEYLAQAASGGSRASDAASGPKILFADGQSE